MRGRWAAVFAATLLAAACSSQCGNPATTKTGALPSPSPTPIALQLTLATFHAGEVGASYLAEALAATGGVRPYRWSVSSGALPDGLTLGSDGSVSGIPKNAGNFSFTIQVADAGGSTTSVAGSISVARAISANLLAACSRACQVEAGCADVCGDFGSVSGGTGPFTYTASGYIPPGVHLADGLSYAGTFSRPVSYWQSTVTVTDSFGETATLSPIFNVYPHISFPGGTITNCSWYGCQRSLLYSGGYGTPTAAITGWTFSGKCTVYSSSPCPPPTPPSISIGGNNVVVNVPGPGPIWGNGYQGTLTVQLSDQSPCGTYTKCSTTGVITVVVSAG